MKKEQIPKGPHSTSTSSRKKKSKTRKFHKVKDAETPGPKGTPPLAGPSGTTSVPISEKEKQSSKSPTQDEQSRLEKIIEKIIEQVLNEKFGTITTPFIRKMVILKHRLILSMMSSLMILWR